MCKLVLLLTRRPIVIIILLACWAVGALAKKNDNSPAITSTATALSATTPNNGASSSTPITCTESPPQLEGAFLYMINSAVAKYSCQPPYKGHTYSRCNSYTHQWSRVNLTCVNVKLPPDQYIPPNMPPRKKTLISGSDEFASANALTGIQLNDGPSPSMQPPPHYHQPPSDGSPHFATAPPSARPRADAAVKTCGVPPQVPGTVFIVVNEFMVKYACIDEHEGSVRWKNYAYYFCTHEERKWRGTPPECGMRPDDDPSSDSQKIRLLARKRAQHQARALPTPNVGESAALNGNRISPAVPAPPRNVENYQRPVANNNARPGQLYPVYQPRAQQPPTAWNRPPQQRQPRQHQQKLYPPQRPPRRSPPSRSNFQPHAMMSPPQFQQQYANQQQQQQQQQVSNNRPMTVMQPYQQQQQQQQNMQPMMLTESQTFYQLHDANNLPPASPTGMSEQPPVRPGQASGQRQMMTRLNQIPEWAALVKSTSAQLTEPLAPPPDIIIQASSSKHYLQDKEPVLMNFEALEPEQAKSRKNETSKSAEKSGNRDWEKLKLRSESEFSVATMGDVVSARNSRRVAEDNMAAKTIRHNRSHQQQQQQQQQQEQEQAGGSPPQTNKVLDEEEAAAEEEEERSRQLSKKTQWERCDATRACIASGPRIGRRASVVYRSFSSEKACPGDFVRIACQSGHNTSWHTSFCTHRRYWTFVPTCGG